MKVKGFSNGVSTNAKAHRTGSSRVSGRNLSVGRKTLFAVAILCFVGVNLFLAPKALALTPQEGEPLRMPVIRFIIFP